MLDFADQQREAAAIRADKQKVFDIINDAKARYVKTKLKAKSKKQTEEAATLFADLDLYDKKQDIQDYYGYGNITITEMDRLMNLWDMREQHSKDGKIYRDRVIEMLEKAIAHIGDEYEDFLYDADQSARENNQLIGDKTWPGGS